MKTTSMLLQEVPFNISVWHYNEHATTTICCVCTANLIFISHTCNINRQLLTDGVYHIIIWAEIKAD